MQDPILASLARFPQALRTHHATLPTSHARFRPESWDGCPSEHFDPLQQVWHLRDIELEGYHVRFRRTLDEDAPLLADIDSYVLAESKGERGSAEQALLEFEVARARTVAMLSVLTPAQFERKATFDGFGPVTVRGLMHLLCSHDHQHLAGLHWLGCRIAAEPRNIPNAFFAKAPA